MNNTQPKSYLTPQKRQFIIERRQELREEIIYVLNHRGGSGHLKHE